MTETEKGDTYRWGESGSGGSEAERHTDTERDTGMQRESQTQGYTYR